MCWHAESIETCGSPPAKTVEATQANALVSSQAGLVPTAPYGTSSISQHNTLSKFFFRVSLSPSRHPVRSRLRSGVAVNIRPVLCLAASPLEVIYDKPAIKWRQH